MIQEPAVRDLQAVQTFCDHWKNAWNNHDGDAVARLCAEDLVYDEPALGDTVFGRDPIRQYVNWMDHNFPGYLFTVEGLSPDIHRPAIVVAWHFSGTHAKRGTRLDFHGDDRLDFNADGLISRYRCLYDNDLVLRQLKQKPGLD